MRRTVVDSAIFSEIGYDSVFETLEILFRSGERYRYFGVPEAIYKELMRAESHGQFFNSFIRDKYHMEQV